MEAKLKKKNSLSGDIFNCPSRFPQAVQIAMLISYRQITGFALLLRSWNLCASIFLLNSESINNAAVPWQLTSRRSKNFWRCGGTYVSRGFCKGDLHRAGDQQEGESFPQLCGWWEELLPLPLGNAPVLPLQTGATQNLAHKKKQAGSTWDFHLVQARHQVLFWDLCLV